MKMTKVLAGNIYKKKKNKGVRILFVGCLFVVVCCNNFFYPYFWKPIFKQQCYILSYFFSLIPLKVPR